MNAVATVSTVALDDALSKRLRRAATHQQKWLDERDELIRAAHKAGASYREIGAATGLSHVGVMKIVNKGTSLEPPQVLVDAEILPDGTIRNILGGSS